MKKQELNWMWIIGIILIGILLYKSTSFSIVGTSYPHSYSSNYNGIPITFTSDNPFGITSQSCNPNNQGPVDNVKDNKIFNNSLIIDFSASIPLVTGGGNLCGDANSNNLLVINKEFKMENIEKIIIKYNGNSVFNGFNQDWCKDGTGFAKLYLSNPSKDILLFSKDYVWNLQSNQINGQIVLFKNEGIYYKNLNSVIEQITSNFNESETFKIAVLTNINKGSCTDSNSALSISQRFEITNLTFIYKNISTCYPKTCSELNKECGLQDNGCGQIITCGQCSNNSYCDNDGQCNLIPLSCSSQGLCADANGTCITCPTEVNCSDWGLCEDTNGNCITCSNDTACTQDVKKCTDGSYVARNSTINCDFNKCPKDKFNWTLISIIGVLIVVGILGYLLFKRKK